MYVRYTWCVSHARYIQQTDRVGNARLHTSLPLQSTVYAAADQHYTLSRGGSSDRDGQTDRRTVSRTTYVVLHILSTYLTSELRVSV